MPAWESYIHRVEPYVPGEQPKRRDIVKLNTNENPYPPSPLAEEAIARLSADTMRLYPDPTRRSPSCFRISAIRSTVCGRNSTGSLTSARPWTRSFGSYRRTT